MNDEFLTRFRKTPRPEFAEALYQRISRQSQPRFSVSLLNRFSLRNAGAAMLFVVLVAACTYFVASQTPYRRVGGIWLTVQDSHSNTFNTGPMSEESLAPSDAYECPLSSLDDAKKILDFDFLIPTWSPDGFTFNDAVCGVSPISDHVSLIWSSADPDSGIGLMIQNLKGFQPGKNTYTINPATVWSPVVPGSYEEVQVNGQPAVLIRGDWGQPTLVSERPDGSLEWESKWDENFAIQLYWVDGEILYQLRAVAEVMAEDLIKMAESAK